MTSSRAGWAFITIISTLIFLPQASVASPTMTLDGVADGVAEVGCCPVITSVLLTTTHANDVIVVREDS